MGLLNAIQENSVDMLSSAFINDKGKTIVEMPADFIGMREPDDVEIMRGDLSGVIYEATKHSCRYIFNDAIKKIKETGNNLVVEFQRAEQAEFDLVIGADGIQSNVRAIVFGPESQFGHSLGDYFFAIFSMPNYLDLDRQELFYARANKVVSVYRTKNSLKAQVAFIFKSPGFQYDRSKPVQQIQFIEMLYADENRKCQNC